MAAYSPSHSIRRLFDQALLVDAISLCLGDVVTEIFGTRRIDRIGHRVCHFFIFSVRKRCAISRICRIVAVLGCQGSTLVTDQPGT
jgi:hypothetical protein